MNGTTYHPSQRQESGDRMHYRHRHLRARRRAATRRCGRWLLNCYSGASPRFRPIDARVLSRRDMVNCRALPQCRPARAIRRPRVIAASVLATRRGDVAEANSSVEERRNRDFVGGVERGRRAAAGAQRLDREAKRGKTLEIGALEGQPAERGEIGRRGRPRRSDRDRRGNGRSGCACRATPCRRSASRRRRR